MKLNIFYNLLFIAVQIFFRIVAMDNPSQKRLHEIPDLIQWNLTQLQKPAIIVSLVNLCVPSVIENIYNQRYDNQSLVTILDFADNTHYSTIKDACLHALYKEACKNDKKRFTKTIAWFKILQLNNNISPLYVNYLIDNSPTINTLSYQLIGDPQIIKENCYLVDAIALSKNGSKLASSSHDHTIRIWDLETSQCIKTLPKRDYLMKKMIISHDDKLIATCSIFGEINILNLETEQYIQTLSLDPFLRVNALLFSNDDKKLISCSKNGKIYIWDLETSQCIKTLNGHEKSIGDIAFFNNDNKKLASCSSDKTIRIWNLERIDNEAETILSHTHKIQKIEISKDDKKLAFCSNEEVCIWNLEANQHIETLKGHTWTISGIAFSNDGKILTSCSRDATIRIWDLETNKCIKMLTNHRYDIKGITSSQDGKILATYSQDFHQPICRYTVFDKQLLKNLPLKVLLLLEHILQNLQKSDTLIELDKKTYQLFEQLPEKIKAYLKDKIIKITSLALAD